MNKKIEVIKAEKPIFLENMGKEIKDKEDYYKALMDLSEEVYHLVVDGEVVSEMGVSGEFWVYSFTLNDKRQRGYASRLAKEVMKEKDIRVADTTTEKGERLVKSVFEVFDIRTFRDGEKRTFICNKK